MQKMTSYYSSRMYLLLLRDLSTAFADDIMRSMCSFISSDIPDSPGYSSSRLSRLASFLPSSLILSALAVWHFLFGGHVQVATRALFAVVHCQSEFIGAEGRVKRKERKGRQMHGGFFREQNTRSDLKALKLSFCITQSLSSHILPVERMSCVNWCSFSQSTQPQSTNWRQRRNEANMQKCVHSPDGRRRRRKNFLQLFLYGGKSFRWVIVLWARLDPGGNGISYINSTACMYVRMRACGGGGCMS